MDAAALHARLTALAGNLAWTWCARAADLFSSLEPREWRACGHAPRVLLDRLPAARLEALATDPGFRRRLRSVEEACGRTRSGRSWFQRRFPGRRLRVAYFCMEFGIHESLPLYSGGLGVLAGDHLKAASDLGVPLAAVGILWREGFHRQEVLPDGRVRALYPALDPDSAPLADSGEIVEVPAGRRRIAARVWRLQVGRVPLYLLDADLPANRPADRRLTARLYHGGSEERLLQELLLGVGGVRALAAVGERPTVFHLNEGHAALVALERLRLEREAGRSPAAALARVRRRTVFTTHTPVPAGHDRFEPALLRRLAGPLGRAAGLDGQGLLALGRVRPEDPAEPFCMTVLALRTAARCNGVSEIHGRVSREMWYEAMGAGTPDGAPLGHVTNGVHRATWADPRMAAALRRPAAVSDQALWEARCALRRRLVLEVRQRLLEQGRRQGRGAAAEDAAARALRSDALTIGFARRFATYKRSTLIFRDPARLARLLGHPAGPAQLLVAGKAHPDDLEGRRLLARIQRLARRPDLAGRVVLLEDYDMGLARLLVAGCDLWLNTPRPPHEASGTSGMKAALNGALNLSLADGWWPEACDGRNGWILEPAARGGERARDGADAEALYRLLEEEVLPLFHARDRAGVPRRWLARVRRALATIPPRFSAARMVREYVEGCYLPGGD